jgi:hypothetical protein
MATNSISPQRPSANTRRITAVALIAEDGHATFPVGPKPFVYREGMRLRIDVIGEHAFVVEMA